MRKSKLDSVKKQRSFQILLLLSLIYALFLLFVATPFHFAANSASGATSSSSSDLLRVRRDVVRTLSPRRPSRVISSSPSERTRVSSSSYVSSLKFDHYKANFNLSELDKAVNQAWISGKKVFLELKNSTLPTAEEINAKKNEEESCPHSIMLTGEDFVKKGKLLVIPCGLTLGSHVTLIAKPNFAHAEKDPKITIKREGENEVMVSQFMMELQGLKTVDGEDPPRILHFNPRLKGDWSGRPVIEMNTCYRMQWGSASRCEGWHSRADEETVDGLPKCEKWIRDDDNHSEESKTQWWLNRLIGRTKKVSFDWPYPFVEDKLFVLTLSAGLEGYHINVDGRHITSFPYRTGFVLEDATGLSVNGDLEVHSIFAASLPTSHPSYAPQRSLEMSPEWRAPPLTDEPVELFIGILSAGNHFAERMAVRKSWMSAIRKSSKYVARFFVALHGRKEVNAELKKEAEYFGDIVIVPYMDSYDLVVLKTVAICEYGIRRALAKHVMKCDDDTFVRIDAVMKEIKKIKNDESLYMGNMNFYHQPLRNGKWAVTYEEWPEEVYPPYANGPGYIVSSDIAQFIVSEFEKHTLRLFKMEDVSMGMWVEQFNSTKPVEYVHSFRYCQFGCIDEYLTAHYQSPRQMLCMWNKIQEGNPQCCNMR